jgi:hypothetical protein
MSNLSRRNLKGGKRTRQNRLTRKGTKKGTQKGGLFGCLHDYCRFKYNGKLIDEDLGSFFDISNLKKIAKFIRNSGFTEEEIFKFYFDYLNQTYTYYLHRKLKYEKKSMDNLDKKFAIELRIIILLHLIYMQYMVLEATDNKVIKGGSSDSPNKTFVDLLAYYANNKQSTNSIVNNNSSFITELSKISSERPNKSNDDGTKGAKIFYFNKTPYYNNMEYFINMNDLNSSKSYKSNDYLKSIYIYFDNIIEVYKRQILQLIGIDEEDYKLKEGYDNYLFPKQKQFQTNLIFITKARQYTQKFEHNEQKITNCPTTDSCFSINGKMIDEDLGSEFDISNLENIYDKIINNNDELWKMKFYMDYLLKTYSYYKKISNENISNEIKTNLEKRIQILLCLLWIAFIYFKYQELGIFKEGIKFGFPFYVQNTEITQMNESATVRDMLYSYVKHIGDPKYKHKEYHKPCSQECITELTQLVKKSEINTTNNTNTNNYKRLEYFIQLLQLEEIENSNDEDSIKIAKLRLKVIKILGFKKLEEFSEVFLDKDYYFFPMYKKNNNNIRINDISNGSNA